MTDKNIMAERRNEEIRMMCADMVEARWQDQNGKTRKSNVLLEDISQSGASMQFEHPVAVGTELKWQSFRGRVRYCTYREIGYFVGVELNPTTPWTRQEFQPQHLFDPSVLRRS